MKKIICVVAMFGALAVASPGANAATAHHHKHGEQAAEAVAGTGVGAVVGAIAGGPVGAVIGGVIGLTLVAVHNDMYHHHK